MHAQTMGTFASAVWITNCSQDNFFNTSGTTVNLVGPSANVFQNANLGVYTQNSGTLILRGAQVKTFKNPASSNVCDVKMFYRVYLQTAVPGTFNSIDLPFLEDCSGPAGPFPSGGPCQPGDQKWQRLIPDGTTIPYSPINLTNNAAGNYVLEVYYEVSGSFTSTTQCNDIVTLNNSGNNYKAFFTIQSPSLSSTNPSSCNGSEGSITISGLSAGASYQVSYTDDATNVGPSAFIANGSGQVIITGLNAGLYSNITLGINGCTTNLNTGIILSNPIYIPIFNSIPPFCAGTTPPVLPTTSNNGITGTWTPAVVDNQNSGTYTFSSGAGQCGMPATISITVIPRKTPVFSFGTALIICGTGTVPILPATSTNGITGTWSPSVVDNQNSGTYTFTPNAGQCANGTTFTVTVNPNIPPSFSFGTSSTICAGGTVPTLPTTSTNGITGTWSPSVVNNQNSGTYTFTPNAGQCATTTTFTLTVNPNLTPIFSFGTVLSICTGGTVPVLPTTSINGISGSWNPSVVSNQATASYIFTSTSTPCVAPYVYTVTVNPIITPTFSFGTFQSVCIGSTPPVLPASSTEGITGAWSPSVVDNQVNGTYTFTPAAGQCANNSTFAYEVNPVPSVTVRTDTSVYDGATIPAFNFIATSGAGVQWTNTNSSIGLAASGSGNVPSFKATNLTNDPVTATITATPYVNGCLGTAQTYVITVLPMSKDVFVPNVFSPNGDGKNDILYVYGTYIDKIEMRIFNQWGQEIAIINNKTQGWDGRYKGTAQPVGVYVYVLKAALSTGKNITLKGSITIIR